MKAQNITLKLPAETVRKIKVVAAERGASISGLLAAKLEELVGEDAEYQAARRRALEWLAHGWHLGGTSARQGRDD
ncbi:MAG TPA: hypothetical protein VK504_27820 [Vicinamibacterales bacterium]|nr:hypothetical protein [Vicinamibacterales bacterium]